MKTFRLILTVLLFSYCIYIVKDASDRYEKLKVTVEQQLDLIYQLEYQKKLCMFLLNVGAVKCQSKKKSSFRFLPPRKV